MANGLQFEIGWVQIQFPDLSNIARLSVGGQKTVLSATHPTDGDVVLKLIHPGQPNETTQREVRAVLEVRSPRVPRILDEGRIQTPTGELTWLREQRINGRTIREILRAGPLDTRLLLRAGLHVLEALVDAEQVRIVHRDTKPDNIMVDGNDDCWLLDFGIARHLALQSLTGTGQIWGKFTLGYAPPEQCRNLKQDIDARSDLFALGVTLYECATGVHPSATLQQMIRRFETLRNANSTASPTKMCGGR